MKPTARSTREKCEALHKRVAKTKVSNRSRLGSDRATAIRAIPAIPAIPPTWPSCSRSATHRLRSIHLPGYRQWAETHQDMAIKGR